MEHKHWCCGIVDEFVDRKTIHQLLDIATRTCLRGKTGNACCRTYENGKVWTIVNIVKLIAALTEVLLCHIYACADMSTCTATYHTYLIRIDAILGSMGAHPLDGTLGIHYRSNRRIFHVVLIWQTM